MTGGNHIDNPNGEQQTFLDGGYGWVVVFASFMIHFIMDGITYSMGDIYLHPMMEVLHSNRARVSTIFAILPAITLISGAPAAILVDKYGYRTPTIIGACLAALGYFVSSFYANIWFYYLAIGVIGGVGFGLLYFSALVIISSYFKQKFSLAVGIAVSGSGLGTMAFPWIMPFIIHSPLWFDYDGALLTEAAIIFTCVFFGLLLVKPIQNHSGKRRLEKDIGTATEQQTCNVVISDVEEQKNQLLSTTQFQESKEPTMTISGEQQPFIDPRSDENNDDNTKISKYFKDTASNETPETLVFNECHSKIPITTDREIVHPTITIDEETKPIAKHSFIHEFSEQFDLKLLKDSDFFRFAISNFLTSLGFFVPYSFANDLAIDANIHEVRRHWIIMSMGISNCFGRLIIGGLGDRKLVGRFELYSTVLIISGTATMIAPFCSSSLYSHIIYASFFGFFSGGYVSLTSVVACDLVGEDKLPNAVGMLSLFQGVATGIGTPVVGAMRDAFSDFSQPYLWPYLIFGGSIVLSGIILIPTLLRRRRQEHHKKQTNKQQL